VAKKVKKPITELTIFKAGEGRTLNEGDKVKVYYNLHKYCYSIKKGKVIVAHAPYVYLNGVTTQINEKGRQRVIAEGKKNVHAYIIGQFTHQSFNTEGFSQMVYNPFLYTSFIDGDTKGKVSKADKALCIDKKAYYI
jgi:hypothetical protein